MAAPLPSAPAVPVVEVAPRNVLDTLPPGVRALYLKGKCSPVEACRFLGIAVKRDKRSGVDVAGGAFYPRAQAYRERIAVVKAKPYKLSELYPRPDGRGGWLEIPNAKAALILVDTKLMVPMMYPEVGWPW